jgi:hypothetical protein
MTEHRIRRGAQALSLLIVIALGLLLVPFHTTKQTPPIPALLKTNAPLRTWKYICIHHSATKQGSAAQFDKTHRKRNMENGLAYHFVIGNGSLTGDGEIEVGDRWKKQLQGGHVKDDAINNIAIGICLVGNFTVDDPTEKQIESLVWLVCTLIKAYNLHGINIVGHSDVGQSVCPGPRFPWQEVRYRIEGELQQDE